MKDEVSKKTYVMCTLAKLFSGWHKQPSYEYVSAF